MPPAKQRRSPTEQYLLWVARVAALDSAKVGGYLGCMSVNEGTVLDSIWHQEFSSHNVSLATTSVWRPDLTPATHWFVYIPVYFYTIGLTITNSTHADSADMSAPTQPTLPTVGTVGADTADTHDKCRHICRRVGSVGPIGSKCRHNNWQLGLPSTLFYLLPHLLLRIMMIAYLKCYY